MRAVNVIRKLLPYTTALLVLAVLNLAWTFYSRWNNKRAIEQAAETAKAQADAQIVKMYASGNLKIHNFYATPGIIHRGEKGLICYGVSDATTVRIEPGVEPVKPSLSRCVEISPKEDTRYTIAAEDASGHRATESFVVRVR